MAESQDFFPDFSKMSNEFYKQWETAMTRWWDQALDSPAFLDAMGKNAAGYAKGRGSFQKSMDEMAERMHVPGKGDLVRLARICTLLEEKLLAQEDQLLTMQDRIDSLEKEVVQSRIEAAEARLEQRERLVRIEELLLKSDSKADVEPRRRKGGE
jgi:hypothetical protein